MGLKWVGSLIKLLLNELVQNKSRPTWQKWIFCPALTIILVFLLYFYHDSFSPMSLLSLSYRPRTKIKTYLVIYIKENIIYKIKKNTRSIDVQIPIQKLIVTSEKIVKM